MTAEMKHLLILFFLSLSINTSAQKIDYEMVETPNLVFKVAPRIFSPRVGVEKVLDSKSSLNFEGKFYAWWLPIGGRLEVGYRRYFNSTAPFGAYVNFKGGFGYFTYEHINLSTYGLKAGGGISFGGQFNVGKGKAVIDVFGGFQWIAPIYLSLDGGNISTFNNAFGYNLTHYLFMAFPLEMGIRFGFFNTIKTPKREFEKDIFYDYTY